MLNKSKNVSKVVIVLMLMVVFCVSLGIVSYSKDALAADVQFQEDKTKEIKIGHLTDTHYYPLGYCNTLDNESYYKEIVSYPKLRQENSAINVQALKDIEKKGKVGEIDYLLVTGDLTFDGEIQAHYEMANLLRNTQNNVREKNENFQIFVIMGNHDLHNTNGVRMDIDPEGTQVPSIDRKGAAILYSGLGFPDYLGREEELNQYYESLVFAEKEEDRIITDPNRIPFTLEDGEYYVHSTNSPALEIKYQNENIKNINFLDSSNLSDAELTYIAVNNDKDIAFVAIDDNLANEENGYVTAGTLFRSTVDWLESEEISSLVNDKVKIGFFHRNALPHFTMQDTVLKDFTINNWRENADFFADYGLRYMFTGHMHANDVETYISFNGNPLTDTQTGSASGAGANYRQAIIKRGTYSGTYAEKYESKLVAISETDFSDLFAKNYLNDEYMELLNLSKFMNSNHICTNVGDYCSEKSMRQIVDALFVKYLSLDFLEGIGDMLDEMLGNIDISKFSQKIQDHLDNINAKKVIDSLIASVEGYMDNYQYTGDKDEFKPNAKGEYAPYAKLAGFVDMLLSEVLKIKLNAKGDTLIDFAIEGVLSHNLGTDIPSSEITADMQEAFNNLKNGTVVKELLNILLDKEKGLYKIINILISKPLDLEKGMTASEKKALADLLGVVGELVKVDDIKANELILDDLLTKAMPVVVLLMPSLAFFDFSRNTLMGFVDELIDSYLTESLYSGLGEIAHNVLYSFMIDESSDGVFGKWTTHYVPETKRTNEITYLKGDNKLTVSVENGKLPSFISVNFGNDPKTDKNFTWFTDYRIEGTDIQYSENKWSESLATNKEGVYKLQIISIPNIDLGLLSFNNIERVIGRHSVELKGLKPNTTYYYRIGSKSDGFWSEVFTFTTAPSEESPFSVLLIADVQSMSEAPYKTFTEMITKAQDIVFEDDPYSFILNLGDSVDYAANWNQWDYFLNGSQSIFANSTHIITYGNHEDSRFEHNLEKGGRHLSIFADADLLDRAKRTNAEYNYGINMFTYSKNDNYQFGDNGITYSLDYSGVHFTFINTNDVSNASIDRLVRWVENDLKSTDKKYKVVALHKGLYSVGSHTKDSEVVLLRDHLTPVFAENNVSLVLQGHDHTYTESYYLDENAKPVKTGLEGKSEVHSDLGVLYITLGTSGNKFYKYKDGEDEFVEFGAHLHNPTLSNPTFGKLIFDGEKLYFEGYQYDRETETIINVRDIKMGTVVLSDVFTSVGIAISIVLLLAIGIKALRKLIIR